ncbi:MAG: hypothetical protein VX341_12350 [Bdellovibrionota bacterium]|nr:hypothetical protein [Bdellovibrionota bacterium]
MKRNHKSITALLMLLISFNSSYAEKYAASEEIDTGTVDCKEYDNYLSVTELRQYAPELTVNVKNGKVIVDYGKASSCLKNYSFKKPEKNHKNMIVLKFPRIEEKDCFDKTKFTRYRPITISIDSLNIDKDKDSRVIVTSAADNVKKSKYFLEAGDYYGNSSQSCFKFETPEEEKWIMANKTKSFNDFMKTVELCENQNAKLSDVTEHLNNLLGTQATDLIEAASDLQKKWLFKEGEKILKELAKIESDIEPGDGDDDYGMSKKGVIESIGEYADHMKKFTDEIVPVVEARLEMLEKRRDTAEKEDNEDLIKEIDKEVKELNELVSKFDRENEDETLSFAILVEAMAEFNLQNSGKTIFRGVKSAEYLKSVYFEREDIFDRGEKIDIKTAKSRVERDMRRSKEIFQEWQDIADVENGKGDRVLKRLNEEKSKRTKVVQNHFKRLQKWRQDYINKACRIRIGTSGQQRCMEAVALANQQYTKQYSYLMNRYQPEMAAAAKKISTYQQKIKEYEINEQAKELARLRGESFDDSNDVWSSSSSSLWRFESEFDTQFMSPYAPQAGLPPLVY